MELIYTSNQDTLRRRFGNSLQWYYSLVNATEHHVLQLLEEARCSVMLGIQLGIQDRGIMIVIWLN